MKLLTIARVQKRQRKFKLNGEVFDIQPRPRNLMRVWRLHKQGGNFEYRVLCEVVTQIPVGIQRLEEAS